MITAVDTNILLDLLIPDAPHQRESRDRLIAAMQQGPLIVSEAVYAELAVSFETRATLDEFLEDAGVRLRASDRDALFTAGEVWRSYARRRTSRLTCARCGAKQDVRCVNCGSRITSRQRVLADFLVGAHAAAHADRLLTRDLGYYQRYFPMLPRA